MSAVPGPSRNLVAGSQEHGAVPSSNSASPHLPSSPDLPQHASYPIRPPRRLSQASSIRSGKSHHGRRSSVISLAGFGDLGSKEPHAAPPTVSAAEAHHFHGSSFSIDRRDRRASSASNLMDAPLMMSHSLPSPLLPNMNNLGSGHLMNRGCSEPVSGALLSPPLDAGIPLPPRSVSPKDPLSTSTGALSRTSTRASASVGDGHRLSMSISEHETSDEPDLHPLFLLLSNSPDPDFSEAWKQTDLLLLPPRDCTPPVPTLLDRPDWVKSHMFKQDPVPPRSTPDVASHWTSLTLSYQVSLAKGFTTILKEPDLQTNPQRRLTAESTASRPERTTAAVAISGQPGAIGGDKVPFPSTKNDEADDEDEILIPFRPALRTIPIRTETTVYLRKPEQPSDKPRPASDAPEKREKPKPKFVGGKLKAPKWLQRASFSKPSSPAPQDLTPKPASPSASSSSSASSSQLKLMRVIALKAPLCPDHGGHETSSQQATPVMPIEQPDHEPESSTHLFSKGSQTRVVPASRDMLGCAPALFCFLRPARTDTSYRDLLFFIERTSADHEDAALIVALQDIVLWCSDFCYKYAYVKGWELYTTQRIRRGILDKVWCVQHVKSK